MSAIWQPVSDGYVGYDDNQSSINWTLGSLLTTEKHNGRLVAQAGWLAPDDIRLCRLTPVADSADVPDEITQTIRGLLEAAIAGTESTIRTRQYHGLRQFTTTEEEWLDRYGAALAWLDSLAAKGDGGRDG